MSIIYVYAHNPDDVDLPKRGLKLQKRKGLGHECRHVLENTQRP